LFSVTITLNNFNEPVNPIKVKEDMTNVLFVCLGNICRSPMAEGILRHKAHEYGLDIEVDSAGIGNWHAGESPDKRAAKTTQERGVDISGQKARQITEEDFDRFDLILVADAQVYDGVVERALNREHRLKVDYIMNLSHPNLNKPVPDPYYGGVEGFEKVYDMLEVACEALIKNVQEKKKNV
jgi:protein-tyrosine phosphatase